MSEPNTFTLGALLAATASVALSWRTWVYLVWLLVHAWQWAATALERAIGRVAGAVGDEWDKLQGVKHGSGVYFHRDDEEERP